MSDSQFNEASVAIFTHQFMNAGADRAQWLQHFTTEFNRSGDLSVAVNGATEIMSKRFSESEVTVFDADVADSLRKLIRNGVISQDDDIGRLDFSNVRRVEV